MSNYHIAVEDIRDMRARVEAECPDDPDLLADMMEGETELHALLGWAIGKAMADKAMQAAVATRVADLAARKARFAKREKAMRGLALELLLLSGVPKVELAEATLSVTTRKPAPRVVDVEALPVALTVPQPPKARPMADIRAHIDAHDGTLPPGVIMTNGSQSLTVRTK